MGVSVVVVVAVILQFLFGWLVGLFRFCIASDREHIRRV